MTTLSLEASEPHKQLCTHILLRIREFSAAVEYCHASLLEPSQIVWTSFLGRSSLQGLSLCKRHPPSFDVEGPFRVPPCRIVPARAVEDLILLRVDPCRAGFLFASVRAVSKYPTCRGVWETVFDRTCRVCRAQPRRRRARARHARRMRPNAASDTYQHVGISDKTRTVT